MARPALLVGWRSRYGLCLVGHPPVYMRQLDVRPAGWMPSVGCPLPPVPLSHEGPCTRPPPLCAEATPASLGTQTNSQCLWLYPPQERVP